VGRKATFPTKQSLVSRTLRGVVEISSDGGASWTDIGVGAYNGSTNAVTSAPIGPSRPAFVNRMVGWPNFAPLALNLGTMYANQDVRIHFRIGADESTARRAVTSTIST
jgi:large repetitive protein